MIASGTTNCLYRANMLSSLPRRRASRWLLRRIPSSGIFECIDDAVQPHLERRAEWPFVLGHSARTNDLTLAIHATGGVRRGGSARRIGPKGLRRRAIRPGVVADPRPMVGVLSGDVRRARRRRHPGLPGGPASR